MEGDLYIVFPTFYSFISHRSFCTSIIRNLGIDNSLQPSAPTRDSSKSSSTSYTTTSHVGNKQPHHDFPRHFLGNRLDLLSRHDIHRRREIIHTIHPRQTTRNIPLRHGTDSHPRICTWISICRSKYLQKHQINKAWKLTLHRL
ncbi:Protein of unknown function [Pyronema omphalodes CBS 100304]|uniref:Uncharacterized protein n=1 Tax=Pyronema omphalodes (strain CBS 100304) TaxID=1076935 RepID=U4LVL3_PYROM|nr:Protein of unknown function [Pyronema omphalodes CBS 100304]